MYLAAKLHPSFSKEFTEDWAWCENKKVSVEKNAAKSKLALMMMWAYIHWCVQHG
jgi:hypothetical protein